MKTFALALGAFVVAFAAVFAYGSGIISVPRAAPITAAVEQPIEPTEPASAPPPEAIVPPQPEPDTPH